MTGRLRRLVALVGIRPVRFALAVLLGSIAVVAGAALLGLAGYLICRAAQQPPILSLTVLMVAVRAVALVRPLARYGERLTSHDLAFRSLGRLRSRLFARIEPLAPAELEEFRDGELLTRMVADIDELQDLVLRIVLPAAVALVAASTIVLGVSVVSLPCGVVLAAGLLASAFVPPAAARRSAGRSRLRQAELRASLTADLVETIDAAPELWLYGADDEARAAAVAGDRDLVAVALDDSRAAGWADALLVAITGATGIAVLVVATSLASSGRLDPLLVAPLALVAIGAFEATAPLSIAARHVPSVLGAGARVLELTEREASVRDPSSPEAIGDASTIVAVDGLDVSRGRGPDRVLALTGADLSVAAGERVVVRGPSGAGKSTLLHVLVRFLERDRGEVSLAGHDVRHLAQDDVRAHALWLSQDPHVFDSDLRENLALARPGATDDEIRRALDQGQLGEWVASLPDGLDTRVGERGWALSGGQRQRLALARAFLADPRVLLLDEPTAHLDRATAQALLDDLWQAAGDRSVVLVSHGDAGPFDGCRQVAIRTAAIKTAPGPRPPSAGRRRPGGGADRSAAAS